MIYNYTKCESVIAKIMADLNSTEIQQRTSDIREWIFEAVDKIGAPMQYIEKEVQLKIEDNQVPLPADLQILDAAAYQPHHNSKKQAMLKTTSIFKEPKRDHHRHHHDIHDPHVPMNHKMITSQSQFYTIQDPKWKEACMKPYDEPEYFIKPGWLVVNRSKGYVSLAYKAIATDERGYPLIPDSSSYQEAIYWYVTMKLSFPKFMTGKLGGRGVNSAGNVYFYIQQQWNFYRNQAYAEAMMPTADDMRNIKNDWNKLIPDWEADDTFFKDQNDRQTIYNDYYYGY